MKILAISHLFPHTGEPRHGIFVARQLQAMAREGADITLVSPRPYRPKWALKLLGKPEHQSHDFPLLSYEGVEAHSISYPTVPGRFYNLWCGRVATQFARKKLDQLHREKKFDIIYGTSLVLGGEMSWQFGERFDIPSTCLAIGTDVMVFPNYSPTYQKDYQRNLRKLSGVLACGERLSRDIDQHTAHKSLCVYGVVDLDRFTPVTEEDKLALRRQYGLPVDKKIVLYVGYLAVEKGLRELISAFQEVSQQHSDACLVFCGGGKNETSLREQVASSQLKNVHFAGPIEPTDVASYMQMADVFALPSYTEGMPNAVMEAMACGLPVVCTTVGGLPDALEDCAGAILIPPKEVPPLSSALSEVLCDSLKREKMSTVAREKAVRDFGAAPNAKKILRYLQTVSERYQSKTDQSS